MGIDLIAFRDTYEGEPFRAIPIQLKSFSSTGFSLDKKYKGMLMTYVWYAVEPLKSEVYIMTFEQARKVANSRFFEKNGRVSITKPGSRIKNSIADYKYSPGMLAELIKANTFFGNT